MRLSTLVLAVVTGISTLAAGTSGLAIRRSDVLADAQSWVDAGVPYSQGLWGSYCVWDYCYPDPLRGGGCYRSDCSGFVSATWGLDAPGLNTWGICDGSISHEISWDELQPGDALILCDQHVMLFKQWIDGDTFEGVEEYSCGNYAEIRRHSASGLRADGYMAIRYNQIEDDPPPNPPPTGWIDGAGCEVKGWAQDPDSPDAALGIHVYVGGPAGDPNAYGLDLGAAAGSRADLCDVIGSCNHGFEHEIPPAWRDGVSRPFYAYTFDASEGFPVLLEGSPLNGSCPRMDPPLASQDGIKRLIEGPVSLEAWRWTWLDVAPLEDSTVSRYDDGPSFPGAPRAVQADDGSPEVWVIDGDVRRHVVETASLVAWGLDGQVQVMATAELEAFDEGLDWPEAPFVFKGSGPETYVLDQAPPDETAEPELTGDDADPDDLAPGYSGGPSGAEAAGGLAAGCSVSHQPAASTALFSLFSLFSLLSLLLARAHPHRR
ncbi:MAG: hypothetical protein HYY06_08190 [Deltaproteobacteria bacterium]|nr:hypothetical protein [Deltaproteobacteria bacterium]